MCKICTYTSTIQNLSQIQINIPIHQAYGIGDTVFDVTLMYKYDSWQSLALCAVALEMMSRQIGSCCSESKLQFPCFYLAFCKGFHDLYCHLYRVKHVARLRGNKTAISAKNESIMNATGRFPQVKNPTFCRSLSDG